MSGHRPVVAALGVALVLAGCGSQTPDPIAGGDPAEGSWTCQGWPVPEGALEDPTPATEVGTDGRAALEGMEVPDDLDLTSWSIVTETDASLVLLRALAQPEDLGAGDVRTHELLAIEKIDAPNVPPPGWMLSAWTSCAINVPGAGSASLTLDPQSPPDPAATSVALLVTERACASGQLATDRVRVTQLRETDGTVEVIVVVDPVTGDATCPGNPPTPFLVELDAPLGERVLLDASVRPAREIVVPTAG